MQNTVTSEQICLQNDLPVVIITSNLILDSYIKGHHVYKDIWTPCIGENVTAEREPDNPMDKYAVCEKKDKKIVGHLRKGKSGRFAKTFFYFLKADPFSSCYAKIAGKRANLGDTRCLAS